MAAPDSRWTAHVVTVSTACARGERPDRSGDLLAQGLVALGLDVLAKEIIPDDRLRIQQVTLRHADVESISLLAFTGGTGPTPDDFTPNALAPLLHRRFDALAMTIALESRSATPKAPLSRLVVGARGRTVIVALPGSPGGVEDALKTLGPLLPHLLALTAGQRDPH